LHGFKNTADYWQRASSKPHLQRMRLPSLVLNAQNDPFVPAHSLPKPQEVSEWVTLSQPRQGGHVGFPVTGAQGWGSHALAMPDAVLNWFEGLGVAHG
jgi:predicted alpha/beta-fold hydrolase